MRVVLFVRNIMHGREGMHRDAILETLARLGGADPTSFFTTGNFACDHADPDALVGDFERWIEGTLGRFEPVYARPLPALQQLFEADPFQSVPDDALDYTVCFAKEAMTFSVPWTSPKGNAVVFRVTGTEAFAYAIPLNGRVSGPGGVVEHLAGQRITSRGWRTIVRIVEREHGARPPPRRGR